MNEHKDNCFFCTGKAESYTDYNACTHCMEGQMGNAVAVFCVKDTKTSDDLAAISSLDGKNLYPTGEYFLLPADKIKELFGFEVSAGGNIALVESEYRKIEEARKQS